MIETKNLSYTYPHSQSPALRNLSLHIPTGALACLLGSDASRWDTSGWLRMPGGLRPVEGIPAIRQNILFYHV